MSAPHVSMECLGMLFEATCVFRSCCWISIPFKTQCFNPSDIRNTKQCFLPSSRHEFWQIYGLCPKATRKILAGSERFGPRSLPIGMEVLIGDLIEQPMAKENHLTATSRSLVLGVALQSNLIGKEETPLKSTRALILVSHIRQCKKVGYHHVNSLIPWQHTDQNLGHVSAA